MIKPLLINTQDSIPIILLEYLPKTKECQISTDGKALSELVHNDAKYFLVLSQLLNRAAAQYIQEYLTQRKIEDDKIKHLVGGNNN